MAIKLFTVKCPECGAMLDIEEGRKQIFCSYCGSKVIVQNDNEYIVYNIDEAEVRQAETDKLLKLKELEIEEKENERQRKGRYTAYAIAGVIAIIGVIIDAIDSYNIMGIFMIEAAAMIALFASFGTAKKKRARITIASTESQITGQMRHYREKNYKTILALYQANGFTNVNLVPLCDLNIFQMNKNGQVEMVAINGDSDFEEGDVFPKASSITITYHSMK